MKRLRPLKSLSFVCAGSVLFSASALAAHVIKLDSLSRQPSPVCMVKEENGVQLDHQRCRAYINGFLDGAELTDIAILNKVKDRSDFLERAYATRVGSGKGTLPATFFADFCIGKDLSRQQIVDEIMNAFEENPPRGADERVAIYQTIKRLYPCALK